MKRISKMIMVLFSLLILAGCSFSGLASNTDESTILITGGITSGAQILASLVAGMTEHYTDKNTAIINNLATIAISHQTMMNGDASISAVRCTGTGLTTTLNLPPGRDPRKTFEVVRGEFKKRYNQTWFPSCGFESTYVFLVRRDTAQKHHLSKVSDLKSVVDELVTSVDTSQINRKGDGYDGFQETCGFSLNSILPMQIGLVYDAVEAGRMDIILDYSTDGWIASCDLVMLENDRQFFPPYDIAPVVDNKVLADTPHLKKALNKLGHTINMEEMQELSCEADNNLVEPSVIAQHFLQESHYFEGE